ncbi:sex peptide receptor [Cydia pomonella]|uniref:sex peptide receptor n=1 Tax=Cydia pomonella TaxID=82600 RepID=UPI002ADDB90E|nr:sex peptide receptor [Cydia pomonella]
MESSKEWPDFFNSTKNFKSGAFEESYGVNDVIDVSPKINYTYYDNFTAPDYTNFTTDNFCASNYSHVYLNVTCEFPIDYAEPMYGYIAPFLLATTTVANTLIVVVLSRRHMRTPTNVVLMAMALCDMFTMLFPAPWLFYMYTFGNHYKPLSPVTACQAWNYMNEVIPAMFHTASIWLTLALAVQRYIYVCHAPVARTWCTMPRVTKCLIYIGIAAFLHQLPRFFDRQFIPHHTVWRGHYEDVCRIQIAPWVHSLSLDAYFISYFGFRVLFVHLIPCTSLVVLNILLFRAMRTAQLNRQKLFKENRKSECKRLRDSNCTTLMLIVVVTVFLLVEIPVAVVTILHIISSSLVEILDYHIANILILITNFFIIVSYPINFAIYCGMSRQFRETFKELFIRGAVTSRKNGGSSRYSLVNGPRTCTNETVL